MRLCSTRFLHFPFINSGAERKRNQSINLFYYFSALKISATKGVSLRVKQLHSPMIKLGYTNTLSLLNNLLSFYIRSNQTNHAYKLFDEMLVRNVMTWNTLLRDSDMGFCYFKRMLWEKVNPDRVTCLNVVSLSINAGKDEMGRQFHCWIMKSGFCKDCYVSSCLVNMYAKFGFVYDARRVFDCVLEKDLVLWNVMVSCYALNALSDDGFRVFWMMRSEGVKGDEFTYTSLVNCCASLAYRELGMQIHCLVFRYGFDMDVVVASALIDLYAKNVNIIDARKVFSCMLPRNMISWNTMIVGYGQCGDGKEAMKLLTKMLQEWFSPDDLTLASVVSSCGDLSLSNEILQVHSYALKKGIVSFLSVSNALVNAHSKCGNLSYALKLFSSIDKPDLVSYTSMVQAYAFHGHSRKAIELFKKMLLERVVNPDKIMFLGVLSACSHGGLVSEGIHYFESMTKDYNIIPELEHYTCLVDLLGRAGLVYEAFRVLVSMPMPPEPDTLGAFMGHCKVHQNLELAKWAGEELFMLEPNKNVNYALLSNALAYSGKWFEVAKVRKKMRDNCCLKIPGVSWLEIAGEAHTFVSRDESHPRCSELYHVLKSLYSLIAPHLVFTD
uniref:pentatricopeptide repeat-containing protein At2g46050, mitochondrial n=1 Tax=Erigeron canadensis TaxID=72917 RepID=UPI001CB965B9|nr:pentatricopeptide repeat-containing protein At2g46050, mitochondrial [Erigeron canadensis]